MCAKKYYILNPSTCTFGNGKYLENVYDNSVIECDEIEGAVQSESIITLPRQKANSKMNDFYILLAFFINDYNAMIIINIYCYYYHKNHQQNLLYCMKWLIAN